MPCRDDYAACDTRQDNRLDLATRTACNLIKLIRRNHPHLLESINLPDESKEWIAAHDLADVRREQLENARKAELKLKQTALSKLTLDERKALGID